MGVWAASAAWTAAVLDDLLPVPVYGVAARSCSIRTLLADFLSSTTYRDELHDVVSPRLMAQFVEVEATLEHVTMEQVVLSFFSLAERRRSFDIEFWIVFMSSLSEDERRFFFSFLLADEYDESDVEPAADCM